MVHIALLALQHLFHALEEHLAQEILITIIRVLAVILVVEVNIQQQMKLEFAMIVQLVMFVSEVLTLQNPHQNLQIKDIYVLLVIIAQLVHTLKQHAQ